MPNASDQPLHWAVGPVTVTRVEERIVPVGWQHLIPAGGDLVDGCRPWIDPFVSGSGKHLLLSVHSFVVHTPDTCIVVDTCVGPGERRMAGDPAFVDRLEAALPAGLEGVDIVVCTHLHFDHVGWNTIERNGTREPLFPNARYLVTQAELDADRDEEDSRAYLESVQPLIDADCLDVVEPNHQIDGYVSLTSSAGHTPGHVSLQISAADASALITGDMVHSPLQLAHPEASSTPDADVALAIETRRRFIGMLADSPVLVLGSHFAPPTAGYLIRDGTDVRFA